MSVNDLLHDTDIQDPSDFPPADVAPGVRQLDEALRCSICRELYQAPVTISCGHCFCSLCIRSVLQEKGECPLCRQSASDTKIRRNPALENAVKAWNLARAYLLRLFNEEGTRTSQNGFALSTPSELESEKSSKKRKRATSEEEDDEVQVVSGPSIPTPSGFKAKDIVQCPVCQKDVPYDNINTHLDSNCRELRVEGSTSVIHAAGDKGKQKQEWSKILGGATRKGKEKERAKSSEIAEDTEYLPKVSYHTLKDSVIKDRLLEHNLPTTGDRNTLNKRHAKWVMMFNANLDQSSTDRKTLSQLRRELQTWEDERKARKQVVTDTTAYEKAHKAEFANLIEAARPRKVSDRGHVAEEATRAGPTAVQDTATSSENTIDLDADDATA
ncbi:hypothetical protein BKA93DRAFT_833243 [Sparassis latifolia]